MKKHVHKISKHVPSVFQGKLDLTQPSRPRFSMTMEHPLESVLKRTLITLFIVLIVAYLYFVTASILNVIARKEAVQRTTQLEGSIALLEQEYFASSRHVTPQTGASLGLVPIAPASFVHRPGNQAAATIGINEI